MHSESPMDVSDYLFLHLMDGNDAQIHDSITYFNVKLEVICDVVNDDRDEIDGCFVEPISSDSNRTRETYFSWNEKIRLKLGHVTDKSSLKISLLRNEIYDIAGSDICETHEMPVRQLVYAEASISIRKLLSVPSFRNDSQSKSGANDTGQQQFKRLDRLLDLKILSTKNSPELRRVIKGTANADNVKIKSGARPLSPDSKIRAAEDAYSAALDELSATWIGLNSAGNPSSKAHSREQVGAELGSSHSEVNHGGVSPMFFRLRLGYMLVTAPGIHGPKSAVESRSRSLTIETTNASEGEGEGAGSNNADCPSLSYHKNIAELTRSFFSGGSSAPRRRQEPSIYGSKDFSSTATGRNVEEDRLLTEHAYISSSSSRLVGRRGNKKGTLRKSTVNPTGVRAAQNIFDELHSMCCQSSFPPTSKSGGSDTIQLEPSDCAEFGRTAGPRSVEKFLACEFEMPSRTFIAYLRVRVSVQWAALVQQLVDELSVAAGVFGGTKIADTCGGLLNESEGEGKDDTHNRGHDAFMDLGPVHNSDCVDHILSGISGIFGDSPEVNGILDLLRAGARVRVVDKNALGGTLSLSRHHTEGVYVPTGRSVPTVAIVRFTESSAIRFLKAAIESQGGLDAGGVKAVLSPALQALLDQSDTRSLSDQMSEIVSLLNASKLEEEALYDILQESKTVTIITPVKSEHFTYEKTRERDFYKCMSDLSGIRALTLTDGSPVGLIKKEIHRRHMVMKREALQLALSQIEIMKTSCAAASDTVFRSLLIAQQEGGHALVSARARNLLLPTHMGSRKSSRSAKKSNREINTGISQGSYADLLLLGRELRIVERMVKQTIASLHSFCVVNQTGGRDTSDNNTEDLKNFPLSPHTHSVRDKENRQWQESSASTCAAPPRTAKSAATATTAATAASSPSNRDI